MQKPNFNNKLIRIIVALLTIFFGLNILFNFYKFENSNKNTVIIISLLLLSMYLEKTKVKEEIE